MKIKDRYTRASLKKAIRDFIATHKCGEPIRVGFLNAIFVDASGKTEQDMAEPVRVPYCERCDAPDGFNHTYSLMAVVGP